MQAIGQLDDDDADVFRHREEHFAQVLDLRVLFRLIRNSRQLGDAVGHGQRVLVVDDLLATGGTIAATLRLLDKLGANVIGVAVLIELEALKGRAALNGVDVTSFITY